jgi:hypothetical protein
LELLELLEPQVWQVPWVVMVEMVEIQVLVPGLLLMVVVVEGVVPFPML